jgi:hypothetical protein
MRKRRVCRDALDAQELEKPAERGVTRLIQGRQHLV